MQNKTKHNRMFTSEMTDTIARIWTYAVISVVDVRSASIRAAQPLLDYRLPGSMLIYAYGGAASVQLNEMTLSMERFGIFHAGKGTLLSIYPEADSLQTFMVLYKAERLPFYRRELQRLQEQINPFVQQFGYAPDNPVALVNIFQRMYESWQRIQPLNRLHAKNLFYQAIHEIYSDLGKKETGFLQPDPVVSAKRYLDEHYMQPLLFQEIADMFGISGGQLTRLFKKREGISLQQYLILKRLEAARRHLSQTNGTIREIAISCGLTDELNLIRMFKRHYKMTPSEYRKIAIADMQAIDIDNDSHRIYNEKGLARLAKSERDGEFTMFGQNGSKEIILAAAMSLMLLLSACSASAPVNQNEATSLPGAQTQQTQTPSGTESNGAESAAQTRTVSTVKGDIEVPVDPQRIIAQSYWRGDVIALGVIPMATDDLFVTGNAYEQWMQDVAVVEQWEAESIMALNPDLIITGREDDYDNFNKIAPTVYVPYSLEPAERLRLIAEALGKEPEATLSLLENYENKVEQAKADLHARGLYEKDFIITIPYDDAEAGVRWSDNFGGQIIYGELGLSMPEAALQEIENGNDWGGTLSLEILPTFIGDYVLVADEGLYDRFKDNEIWSSVPAVQQGRVIVVESSQMYFSDIYSKEAQLDMIVNQIIDIASRQ